MKLLHILVNNLDDLPGRIAEAQSREHEVDVIDLSLEGFSYDSVVDAIFSCDKVILW